MHRGENRYERPNKLKLFSVPDGPDSPWSPRTNGCMSSRSREGSATGCPYDPHPYLSLRGRGRQLIGDSGGVPLVLQEQVRRDLRPQPLLLAALVDEVPNGRELHPVAA